jgi:X-X-X-Leu-X-X-Gly heptad repeat protein
VVLEADRVAAGVFRLAAGAFRLAAGAFRLAAGVFRPDRPRRPPLTLVTTDLFLSGGLTKRLC